MFKGGDKEKLRREFPARDCPIGLDGRVFAAQAMETLKTTPQCIYRPRRLVVDRSYPSLFVVDLKIGNCSQVMTVGEFPLDVLLAVNPLELMYERLTHFGLGGADNDDEPKRLLAACLEELTAIRNNLGRVDTCQIGQTISLTLRNASSEAIDFKGALLFGDAALFGEDGKALT